MRHHKSNRKFGRVRSQRKALLKSLLTSLIRDESIVTTEAKAKEIRPLIEKLVTKAKKADITVSQKRLIMVKVGSMKSVSKLCKDIAPKYVDRKGGYTRIIKLPLRKADAAKMAQIEFV
jgi:large subunit ribosomal protein L17